VTPSDSGIQELLERLNRGDQQTLAELFSRYRGRLSRMVSYRLDRRLNGRVSPSDVLQEAYIDAAQRVHHYIAQSESAPSELAPSESARADRRSMSFFVWLRQIVQQRMIDLHRHHLGARMRDVRREVRADGGDLLYASTASLADHFVANRTTPSQALLRAEALAQLEEALSQVDPVDREVLALRHLEELSNNEVAEVLGIKKAAASNRYVRALGRLKDLLATIPGFADGQE